MIKILHFPNQIFKAILIIAFCFPFICFSQTYKFYKTQNYHNQLRLNTATGEVLQIQDDGGIWTICSGIEAYGNKNDRFSLTETQNMWNYIMLDTFTGKTWQVQFSVKGEDYMFCVPINIYSLSFPRANDNWRDRFQLYSTKNMWNFILLDSYTGRLWQVQYSAKDFDNLMCLPINNFELAEGNRSIFSISPMTSMYQFYLTNNYTGEMWKFQWSTKGDDYRWIERF